MKGEIQTFEKFNERIFPKVTGKLVKASKGSLTGAKRCILFMGKVFMSHYVKMRSPDANLSKVLLMLHHKSNVNQNMFSLRLSSASSVVIIKSLSNKEASIQG